MSHGHEAVVVDVTELPFRASCECGWETWHPNRRMATKAVEDHQRARISHRYR